MRYNYVSMAILAGYLVGILGFAIATRQWTGVGLAAVALVVLVLLIPRARRQQSSRG